MYPPAEIVQRELYGVSDDIVVGQSVSAVIPELTAASCAVLSASCFDVSCGCTWSPLAHAVDDPADAVPSMDGAVDDADGTDAEVMNPLSFVRSDVADGIAVLDGSAPTSDALRLTAPVLPLTLVTGADVRKPLSLVS